MSSIKKMDLLYTIGVADTFSDPVKAKPAVAVSRAFSCYPQSVEVWCDGEVVHSFELAIGEGIEDFARAQLEDVDSTAMPEWEATLVEAVCKDILFIR